MEFLRMVGEPFSLSIAARLGPGKSRARKISISLFSPANSSQHLSGIIEAALPDLGAEAAIGIGRRTAAEL
jgi:hypothetical protein